MGSDLSRWSVVRLSLLLGLAGILSAQEGGGQAEIGFQQYYLQVGANRVANISGLAINFDQFIPDIGLLSGSIAPALSNARFRTGDDYLRLKGLPWRGQHWTFSVGDFRLPGQLLRPSFTNIYVPEIAGRGVSVEATHGGRTFGFFYGTGTIANSPRVVLRLGVPQTLQGLYFRQKVGSRLLLGARLMHVSNDLAALQRMPNLLTQGSRFKAATTVNLNALYTIAGPLKWYAEGSWSASSREGADFASRKTPFSTLLGPVLESKVVRLRANYTFQSTSYFPVLGYYLGDRQGPFGEITVRPIRGLEIYGSASRYQNNVAKDPTLATFRNSTESAGASIQLPGRISLNGQLTLLDLWSRNNAASPWEHSKSQQQTVTVARPFARHNLRLTARDFRQASALNPQRERSAEIEDTFHFQHFVVGGGVRIQRLRSAESRTTLFYRGVAQVHTGRLTAYANLEFGNDMQNRTLFATNTISTTVFGASLTLNKNWDVQAEAYRNNLLAELNPQSIFVLQGQGLFIPGTLTALNQWSVYVRMSRRFHWGKAGAASDLVQYAIRQAPLKGSVEGFVMERLAGGNRPAEGVPVNLDEGRTVLTDTTGHFQFSDVAEGMHRVGLALQELPAEYDPGKDREAPVVVAPNRPARADLDVIRLGVIAGKITGPPNAAADNVVIRIVGSEQYTTPSSDGSFYFYNLREGEYDVAVDLKTLPEFAAIKTPDHIRVMVRAGQVSDPLTFEFEIHKPEKPVRTIVIGPPKQ